MASVYFGRIVGSEGFSRVVAIKRMHPHLTESADFRAMFIDEARLAARINHPNVAQIIDLVAEDEELLLVMSYVHGVSVGSLLHAGHGPLSVPVAVRIAIDGLYGLHAAHTARDPAGVPLGVVHRDVSPQNLLTSSDGITLVVDFGVAKAAARLQTSREGQLKGKIRYMPPEQIRQGPIGPQTDVYALAVVLWEMLTGHRLFTGSSDPAVLAQVLDGTVTRPSTYIIDLSPALEDIIMCGLAREAANRFPSALAMAEALEGLHLAASPREVAAVVSSRAGTTLAARETALQQMHDDGGLQEIPVPTEDSLAGGTLSGRHDAAIPKAAALPRELPVEPPVASKLFTQSHAVRVLVVVACVMLASRPSSTPANGTALPASPGPASSSAPARSAEPLPEPAPASPPATDSRTSAAPSSVPPRAVSRPSPVVAPPVSTTRRTHPATPPADCAQNPRVLGPDGLYEVRKECLGH